MTRIVRTVDIDETPERVFRLLRDPAQLGRLASFLSESQVEPSRPVDTVGQRFRLTVTLLGRRVETEWLVSEYDEPRRLTYQLTGRRDGAITLAHSVTPRPGGGSQVELQADYLMPGGLLGMIVQNILPDSGTGMAADRSLRSLKELAEGDRRSRAA